MTTSIRTQDVQLVETRRNRFKEPWPTTALMYPGVRMTTTFYAPNTRAAYVKGVVSEAGTPYMNLTSSNNRIPVTPGELIEYTAETSGTGSYNRYLRLYFLRADGSVITAYTDGAPENVGTWKPQSVQAVAPEEAAFAGVYVLFMGGIGTELFIRKVSGGPAGGFFDGHTAPFAEFSYSWAGATNASESIESAATPVVRITPTVVNGYKAEREARTIIHPILGRTNPDVTLRPASLRTGTLELLFRSEADAVSASANLAAGRLWQLESDERDVNMTFVTPEGERIGLELDDETRDAWRLTVPYQEVSA